MGSPACRPRSAARAGVKLAPTCGPDTPAMQERGKGLFRPVSLGQGPHSSRHREENMLSFVCPRSVFLEIDRCFYLNKHRHEPWHVCGMALACWACFELAMMSIRHLRCPRDIPEEVRVALSECTFSASQLFRRPSLRSCRESTRLEQSSCALACLVWLTQKS